MKKTFTLLILLMVGTLGFSQETTVKENRVDNPIRYDQQGKSKAVIQSGVSLQSGEIDAKRSGQNNPTVLTREQIQHQGAYQLPSESTIKGFAEMNPERTTSDSGKQVKEQSRNSDPLLRSVTNLGENNPVNMQRVSTSPTVNYPLNQDDIEAEILADATYRANNPVVHVSLAAVANRPMADITPAAGATETFTPAVGDNFFDPGGPGGANSDGNAGNYPNCNCDTQTTLAGVSEIEFLDFGVNGTFDYLRIYDGTDATGTILYDNSDTGANTGDKTLANMIASHGSATFTATSGNFFFFFHASGVVNWLGWDALIVATDGGGGGGDTCSEENPNDGTFENGFNCSSASAFMLANDVTVAAGEDFTLTNITASIFANGGISNVDVNYYSDTAGLPGTMIGSQAGVTIDNQTVIGANFGFDVNEIELTVDPFVFTGQDDIPTTYWIELSVTDGGATGSVFWVVTSSTSVGNPTAQFDAGWAIADPLFDGVYIFEGTCEATGGGGGGTFPEPYCGPLTFGSNVEPITLVEVAGISNRTDAVAGGSPAHEDFTAIVGDMTEDESYPIALEGNTDGNFTNSFTVFIDWDQDGILDNAGERYEIGTIVNSDGDDGIQAIGSIVVPAGVAEGPTRMRVIKKFQASFATDSCTPGSGFGQAEDYTIEVTAAGGGTFPEPYCGPLTFGSNVEPITLVEVAGISNRTDAAAGGSPAHEDFTAIVGDMTEDESYPIALEGNTDGNFTNSFTVFIDWDQDGILDNAGERYEIGTIVNSDGDDGIQAIGSIVVPAGVAEGPTRMRVIKKFQASFATDSCTPGSGFGQAEDYTIEVTAGGGGGGDTCSEENPNDGTFENGFNCSSATAFMTANDVTVAAGEDFTLTNITASIFANDGIANVDVNYYSDTAGLPGTLIGSQAAVTIDNQTVIGANFGFDVNEVELTVDPFVFVGQDDIPTTYWVELSVTDGGATGSVFWVVTSSTSVGNPAAQFDAGWTIGDPLFDGVYIFEGECVPTGGGGGGDTCSEENPNDGTFENGFNCSSATAFMTANDVTVAAGEDFTLTNITASIFANDGIANVDVNYYDDAAGLPGTMIGSQAAVTIDSQTVIGTNFGFDVNEIELTVDPFVFVGQDDIPTTYWVELSVTDGGATGSVFWVVTSSTSVGNPAAQFDAVWAIADPLFDGVYIFEGICEATGGGGGGDTCSEENPNDGTFENGFNCSSATAFMTANDVTVAAGEDFTLTNITASIFANDGIANVDVNYYDDAAGLPGTMIGSQASVTIDNQTVIGTNFGFDVNEIELTVDPFVFVGQDDIPTTYWVELSVTDGGATGSVFWVVTSSTSVGNPAAQFDAVWAIADPLFDGVYIFEGICEATGGGGGDTCSEENPNDGTFENGFNCSSATAFMTANDVTVAAGEDFTLTNITASIFANDGIANVDVNYYDDAAGLPGTMIGSQASVTIDNQTVIGNNFGFDVNEIELTVDPFVFEGQNGATTTYWIELSVTDGGATGSVFWVVTSSTSVGNPAAQFDAVWAIADPLFDGVYIFEGECEPTVGIEDNSLAGFNFYPNPANEVLYLNASKNIESVELFNMLGQRVLSNEIGTTSSNLNVEGLAVGTYIMKVTVDGQTGTYKVIKN